MVAPLTTLGLYEWRDADPGAVFECGEGKEEAQRAYDDQPQETETLEYGRQKLVEYNMKVETDEERQLVPSTEDVSEGLKLEFMLVVSLPDHLLSCPASIASS